MKPLFTEEDQAMISSLFYQLVSVRSDTNTPYECIVEDVLLGQLQQWDYYIENSEHVGAWDLKGDQHKRKVVWALARGEGDKTVVMINHHDAVDAVEYGKLQHLAFRPEGLKEAIANRRKKSKILQKDVEDDRWIFGRGTADMKAGTALQLGVLDKFIQQEERVGNMLFISVPDEETLSAGMLAAVELMGWLKEQHGLQYSLMVNSEPYFTNVKDKAILYEGSVGKIMPVVYVKGVKSHIGDPFTGVNPSLILGEIQRRSEMNTALCDIQGADATPPPVWVHLKDRKKAYDASIPEAAVGYFNWLTFTRTPSDVMDIMKVIAEQSMVAVLARLQSAYETFCMMNREHGCTLEYEPIVYTFEELYAMTLESEGEAFEQKYEAFLGEINDQFRNNDITLPEASVRLLEFVAETSELEGPAVVLGLSGPYYPHISNRMIEGGQRYRLLDRVNRISTERYGLAYQSNGYFMGICDLSYAGFVADDEDIDVIRRNSPGWDTIYRIPFGALNKLSMPVVNIGPWGKDLHKTTERVFGPDVFKRIPTIIFELSQQVILHEEARSRQEAERRVAPVPE